MYVWMYVCMNTQTHTKKFHNMEFTFSLLYRCSIGNIWRSIGNSWCTSVLHSLCHLILFQRDTKACVPE